VHFCLACGEPPMCMSCSALFAVKKAIESARKEIDNKDFFSLCKSMNGMSYNDTIRSCCA